VHCVEPHGDAHAAVLSWAHDVQGAELRALLVSRLEACGGYVGKLWSPGHVACVWASVQELQACIFPW